MPINRDQVVTFRPGSDVLAAMTKLQQRDGVPPSEQIRRALRQWLKAKGVYKEKK